nr:immunoglobulin light chain junction region [Macaca mulatta]
CAAWDDALSGYIF